MADGAIIHGSIGSPGSPYNSVVVTHTESSCSRHLDDSILLLNSQVLWIRCSNTYDMNTVGAFLECGVGQVPIMLRTPLLLVPLERNRNSL